MSNDFELRYFCISQLFDVLVNTWSLRYHIHVFKVENYVDGHIFWMRSPLLKEPHVFVHIYSVYMYVYIYSIYMYIYIQNIYIEYIYSICMLYFHIRYIFIYIVCIHFFCTVISEYHTRIATHTAKHTATHCNTLQHTAIHCNTLQHTATHCNTLRVRYRVVKRHRMPYLCRLFSEKEPYN